MARTPLIPEDVNLSLQQEGIQKSILYAGDNRILLNDYSLFPDESVDLIVTDPPYAIGYRSNRRTVLPKFNHIQLDDNRDWIEDFCKTSYRVLKPNSHFYCFCRWDTYPYFFVALQSVGFHMKRTLVWVKDNHGSGDLRGDYAPQDEWIIFAVKGRKNLIAPRISNVIEIPKISSSKLVHPTEKPIDLLKVLISKSTIPREFSSEPVPPATILDPFMGSGSTGVAAIKLGHQFIGIEIDEEYFETACLRLPNATHKNCTNLQIV
ncbi:MAG: site-specific DNA-methyltransferase [bacterium]|nr:site-specific DNA-methyltransferase [bacterium]